ncbi:MAG: hypothetical protein WD768_23175 [Phycisphaeraceae bacterium]
MSHPLVIAYHLIWTVYGWWLPNDPRGSGSRAVRNDVISHLGDLHYGRKRVQPAGWEVKSFYDAAKDLLKHDLIAFNDAMRQVVADAFAHGMEVNKYTCYACAIMPDHVHILIRKHKYLAEDMIDHLRDESRLRLSASGLLPPNHPIWTGGGGWKVFLDHPDEVWRTIRYIDRNPQEIGIPAQSWPFVTAYDNWPLFEGHSPNSPYAKALKAAGRYPRDKQDRR